MSDQPIAVSITVGSVRRDVVLVGDPGDALFAVQLGRTVGILVLELARDVT